MGLQPTDTHNAHHTPVATASKVLNGQCYFSTLVVLSVLSVRVHMAAGRGIRSTHSWLTMIGTVFPPRPGEEGRVGFKRAQQRQRGEFDLREHSE